MVSFPPVAVLAALLFQVVVAKQHDNSTYDYIVVGSGPGGAPVATNLARAGHSVLLLEAGTDQSADISTQILAIGQQEATNTWDFYVKLYSNESQALRNNHLTWQRADGSLWVGNGTTPPADAHPLGVYYPRGATLGGSSVINAGVTVLPAESYWDSIATLTGDKSWNAKSIRQIFERIEDNHYLRPSTPGHGFSGYLDTNGNDGSPWTHNPGILEVLRSMVATTGGDANQTISLVQRDINSVKPDRDTTQGLFGLPFHVDEKWGRFSARELVLATLRATKKDGSQKYPLTLQTNSLATRILFGHNPDRNPTAIGVEYFRGQSLYSGDRRSSPNITGTVRQVYARKEVIVSGGVFNSPQLLLLSGIGPKEDLAKLNIPVIVDLPGVGKRLQENQELPIVGHMKQPNVAIPFPEDPTCTFGAPGDPCVAAWRNGTGPYARSGINTNAFMLKSNHTPDGELDLLLFGLPFPFRGYWRADANVTIPPDPPTVFGISMVHIKAQNRAGELKLRSNNPRDTPDINFHFFEDGAETDLGAMADAVAWGRRVYGGVAAPYGPVQPTEPPLVGSPQEQRVADYQWIKDQAFGHHASGTCGMGPDDDELAVLDAKFRVRGVDGLRVVDGSAFPSPPGAFPVVPTYLISEKASRDILGDT